MKEVWEDSFVRNQEMWGLEPADSAIAACDFFLNKGVTNILIPGFGYGRNAKLFKDHGINVTGIEISQTAIDLAHHHYGTEIGIHHGSVTDMPFDNKRYDGIFCYGLLYLLDSGERKKFLADCYHQLEPGGYMIFSVISTSSPNYGLGKQLGENWFELMEGVRLFFYDAESVKLEFEEYGILECIEIDEPIKNLEHKSPFRFWLIKSQK